MNKEPRLRFTEEERADPALEKPIRKAEKAAVKADKAQAKIPKKQVKRAEVDPKTGKVKHLGGHKKDGPEFAEKSRSALSRSAACCCRGP